MINIKATTIYIPEPEIIPEPDIPIPPDGKAWKRKIDGVIFPCGLYLGMRHFGKNGNRLKTPVKETPDDYELVDISENK